MQFLLKSNCFNHIYHPNLLLIVNKSKKIEVSDIKKPEIINGFDFLITFSSRTLLEDDSLSFATFIRLEKGLITIKILNK